MRRLLRESERDERELIEGIKIYPKKKDHQTSVYLRPDPARPLFHINAESPEGAFAEELAESYEKKILHWIDTEQ